jgi:hypothetical protein
MEKSSDEHVVSNIRLEAVRDLKHWMKYTSKEKKRHQAGGRILRDANRRREN